MFHLTTALDAASAVPLYEQLYAALADEIRTGQRAPGTPLPGRRTMAAQQGVSVNTVDGFQGQERDVILISLVRSNAEGQIGFLRDLRRMNVAITRARMKLMILGDPATLCRHPFYKRLYDYVRSLGGTEAADPEATP